jgi:opacity protein-like surface antigen
MKKLLVAASVAAGLAAGAVPALAQSTTTGQADWPVSAANGAASWVEAHNYNRAQAAISNAAYVGGGSDSDYLRQQQELQNMPGYSVGGNG